MPPSAGASKKSDPHGLALAVISLAELYEGVYYSRDPERNERALHAFLGGLTLIGVEREACQVFGRERGRLRAARRRRLIADFDLLIGAPALRHDLTLLTNNRRDFEAIQGLTIESQEDTRPIPAALDRSPAIPRASSAVSDSRH